MFHNLEMINNASADLVIVPLQLLHIPKLLLPALHRTVLPLQKSSLHPECNTAPDAPTEIRRQCRLVDRYPAPATLYPVLFRQLAIRNLFYGMIYAHRWVSVGVVRAEDAGGEVRR